MPLPSHAPPDAGPAPVLPPARAYGHRAGDLDLDPGSWRSAAGRPALVTGLLASCCEDEDSTHADREAAAWNLSLGERITRLLAIVQRAGLEPDLVATLGCPEPGCRREFEVSLPFAALHRHARESAPPDNIVRFPSPRGPAALRLPTGRDQSAWLGRVYSNPDEALSSVVRSLLLPGPGAAPELDSAALAAAAAAMESADPLVAFRVSTVCPHCRAEADIPVDLEATALARLAAVRAQILRDVHALATRYGWTEAEVLALPPDRRAEYRRLIAAEETDWA